MKTYYILALCLWMVSPSLAQDMSIFSQRSSDLVSQFPSLMAFHGAMDANVLYRSHWAGIGAGANASGYVHPIRSAIGLSHQYLRFGASRVHSTHFAISPRMAVSEDLMLTSALGLNIGTHNVKAFPSNEEYSGGYFNLRVGLGAILKQKHYVAINYFDQMTATGFLSERKENGSINLLAGTQMTAAAFRFTPQVFASTNLYHTSVGASLTANFKGIVAAVSFSSDQELNAGLGYEYKSKYRLFYSYQDYFNGLIGGPGAHELAFRALLFQGKAKSPLLPDLGIF